MNFSNELKNFLKNRACNPNKMLYTLQNNKELGGFHLVDIIATAGNSLQLSAKKNKVVTSKKGLSILGKGAEGVAYIGCLDSNCRKVVVIKVSSQPGLTLKLEYNIAKKLFKLSPHIPTPYMYVRCGKDEFMYAEYASGGDLAILLSTYKKVLKPIHIRYIIFQVLITLLAFQKMYPSFKHNDMHLKNVLLDINSRLSGATIYKSRTEFKVPNIGLRALISDYGFAHMDEFPNPKVVSKEFVVDYGIAPDSHKLYDAHLFLLSLYLEVIKIPSLNESVRFIENIFPPEYLKSESVKVKNHRLRYDVSHSRLLTLDKILSNDYFNKFKITPNTSKNNITNTVSIKNNSPNKTKKIINTILSRKENVSKPMPLQPPPIVKINENAERLKAQFLARKEANKIAMLAKRAATREAKKALETPSPKYENSDNCGAKAKPSGVGAQKLTTKEMVELIKLRGYKVPSGNPKRQQLCGMIKTLDLYKSPVPVQAVVAPVPVHAIVAQPVEALRVKNFLADQGVIIKPATKEAIIVGGLSNKKLWDLHRSKLRNNIYDTLNKSKGTYENRMDEAGKEAFKIIKEKQEHGNKPPAYIKK